MSVAIELFFTYHHVMPVNFRFKIFFFRITILPTKEKQYYSYDYDDDINLYAWSIGVLGGMVTYYRRIFIILIT